MKILDKRARGGARRVAQGGRRHVPASSRSSAGSRNDGRPATTSDDAKNGDLVEVEQAALGRYGLPRGKVLQVLGSLTSEKAVSMIAIHAHDIPHIFPPDVLAEAEAVEAGDDGRPRGLARPAADHHRSGRRQGP